MAFFIICLVFLASIRQTLAFWRMPCANYPGVFRLDAILSPGEISIHGHSLAGSSSLSLNSTYGSLVAGASTSCAVSQDHSAYWYVSLHEKYIKPWVSHDFGSLKAM